MKRIWLLIIVASFAMGKAKAQTATELLGKWKLVKWTSIGKDKAVDGATFQIFRGKDEFVSVAEGKEHKGKWKLSKDNQTLTIRSGLFTVKFSIDQFDKKKRVISSNQVGTLEYEKVEE